MALLASLGRGGAEVLTGHPAGAFGRCIGDCNNDGRVAVEEIVLGVRLALVGEGSDACPAIGARPFIGGLVTSVQNSLLGCTAIRDLSGFAEFVYEQAGSFGFCPELGSLQRAAVRRGTGGYVLERSVIETGNAGNDDCLPQYLTGKRCLVIRPLPCRMLTAEEVERVNGLFEQVTVWTAADAFCLSGAADLCLVHNNTWDALATNDHVCASGSRLDAQQSARLTELVNSLGAGPETACESD
jgi:hypothetical protein